MAFFYTKQMGNGSVESKFRLDVGRPRDTPAREPAAALPKEKADSNCTRCYRIKRSCSRTLPSCDLCSRLNYRCEYVDRKFKRAKREPERMAIRDIVDPTTEAGSNSNTRETSVEKRTSSEEKETLTEDTETENVTKTATQTKSGSEVARVSSEPHSKESPTWEDSLSKRSPGAQSKSPELLSKSPEEGSSKEGSPKSTEGQDSETFHNIDLPSTLPPVRPPHRRLTKTRGSVTSLDRQLMSSAVAPSVPKLEEEFLVVQPISDVSLPSAFVHAFFSNYEWKYPFLSRPEFYARFQNLQFHNETFVQVDVYMVMAIGCLVHDASYGTRHYNSFFSDSLIESVIEIVTGNSAENDVHRVHIVILLAIYAATVSNTDLLWSLQGFLNRLVVGLCDFKINTKSSLGSQKIPPRTFWTVFNLDKEFSLLMDKPSSFVPTQIIAVSDNFAPTLVNGESEKTGQLMGAEVELHKLHDRLLSLRIGLQEVTKEALSSYLADLEKWRASISSLISAEYAGSALLQNFQGLVNLDYHFLLIQLDQFFSTGANQLTLQFLSSSFSLLLSEQADKKESVGSTVCSVFWFLKLFHVADHTFESLVRLLRKDTQRAELVVRLNDFNGNVQLMANLVTFVVNSKVAPDAFAAKLTSYTEKLKSLNGKLGAFNPLMADKAALERLAGEIEEVTSV